LKKVIILFFITILLYFLGYKKKESSTISTNNVSVESEIEVKSKDIKPTIKDEGRKLEKNFIFNFTDIDDNNHTITVNDKKITINDSQNKVILLNFFSSKSPACMGQIPYLIDIQKRYGSKIFIAGILLNSKADKYNLKTLLAQEDFNYIIYHSTKSNNFTKSFTRHFDLNQNFSPPVSVLFKDGNYYTHYEGAVPIEMLEYDITNITNKEK